MKTNNEPELAIETLAVKKAALNLRALNHPLRLKLLMFIHQKGMVSVTEMYIHFGLEQSVTSQHLAILRRAGLTITKRNGRTINYSVNQEEIKKWHELFKTIL